jgi:hypothetical protein
VSLRAPLAVPVEVTAQNDKARVEARVFRLADRIGTDGVRLVRPAPFEIGRPVTVRLALPDGGEPPLQARARVALTDDDGDGEAGGRELAFTDLPGGPRAAIERYIVQRLGLPRAP